MRTLTVKIPDELFAEITQAAKSRNLPKSEIARERLSVAEDSKTKKTNLWNQIEDLVIQEDSLPIDLSSNKKHLQGYGENAHH